MYSIVKNFYRKLRKKLCEVDHTFNISLLTE